MCRIVAARWMSWSASHIVYLEIILSHSRFADKYTVGWNGGIFVHRIVLIGGGFGGFQVAEVPSANAC